MLSRPTNPREGERGSVVIAISVLVLLLLIGTTLIARSQAELGAAAAGADAEAAQAGAEQGVAEVLALLDSGESGAFSGNGVAGDGTYVYEAEQVSDTEYFVRARGTFGDRVRQVEVTIAGEPVVVPSSEYTLLLNHDAYFLNNGGTITGPVATNGRIDVQGTAPGDFVDLYGSGARCTGCPVTNTFPTRLDMPEPPIPTGTTRNCPRNGRFTGAINGRSGVPYVCTRANMNTNTVRFLNTVRVVNPPLIIYVREGLDVLIRNASVNTDGDPNDFQLSAGGERTVYWWYDIWNSSVNGVLTAPNRDWLVGAASINGPVSAGVMRVQSPNDVWITPLDTDTPASGASGWTVTSWEQVPAS